MRSEEPDDDDESSSIEDNTSDSSEASSLITGPGTNDNSTESTSAVYLATASLSILILSQL